MTTNDMIEPLVYPCTTRRDLKDSFDGSPKRPIRTNQEFDVWNLVGYRDINLYVEKGKAFSEHFWNDIHARNIAVIFVESKRIGKKVH